MYNHLRHMSLNSSEVQNSLSQPYVSLCSTPLRFTNSAETSVVFYDEEHQQEFFPIKGSPVFSQTSRRRGASPLLNFYWLDEQHMMFVTQTDIELHEISDINRTAKLIKYYSLSLEWFIYSSISRLLVACPCGSHVLQAYWFTDLGHVTKPVCLDLSMMANLQPNQTDICIAMVYGRHYILRKQFDGQICTEVELYQVGQDSIELVRVLHVGSVGCEGISVTDNLIIVHHKGYKLCSVFDILSASGTTAPSSVAPIPTHRPILLPSPLGVCQDPQFPLANKRPWTLFQPDVIIDSQHGYVWKLTLDLTAISSLLNACVESIDFLHRRAKGKSVLLEVLTRVINPVTGTDLITIGSIMTCLAIPLATMALNNSQFNISQEGSRGDVVIATGLQDNSSAKSPSVSISSSTLHLQDSIAKSCSTVTSGQWEGMIGENGQPILTQHDIYLQVFKPLESLHEEKQRRVVQSVLMEYVRAMIGAGVVVIPSILVMLVTLLVESQQYHMLHQLLHRRIISGSHTLAHHLLRLSDAHPPLLPLALDMFKLLKGCDLDAIDIMLANQEPINALRFAEKRGLVRKLPAAEFLKVAAQASDTSTLHNMVSYYQHLDKMAERSSEKERRLFNSARESLLFGCEEYVLTAKRVNNQLELSH